MSEIKCNITYKVNKVLIVQIFYLSLDVTYNNIIITPDIDHLVRHNVLDPVFNILRTNKQIIFNYDDYSFHILNKSNILKAFK